MILFDVMFLPIVEKIWKYCPTVKHWVALTDPEHMPAQSSVPGLLNYEQLLQGRHREGRAVGQTVITPQLTG